MSEMYTMYYYSGGKYHPYKIGTAPYPSTDHTPTPPPEPSPPPPEPEPELTPIPQIRRRRCYYCDSEPATVRAKGEPAMCEQCRYRGKR
jgi:hypothetical protein